MNGEKTPNDLWRTIAGFLGGVVLALVGCIWNMDRDRATKADLKPITSDVAATRAQVQSLSEDWNFVKGQLKAEKLIDGGK